MFKVSFVETGMVDVALRPHHSISCNVEYDIAPHMRH
jgi:hypothetical protein